FAAESVEELRARVAGGMPPPPKDGPVPAHVWAAIARGLQPLPERRFPDMDGLLAVLNESIGGARLAPRSERVPWTALLPGWGVTQTAAWRWSRVRSAP